jgi:hypothetical protein
MNEDLHISAQSLIDQDRVEGISPEKREWLDGHLEACAECARHADVTEKALRSLRAVSVSVPPALASHSQLRVYLRAQELRQQGSGGWALWVSCAISWVLGMATAPYVWSAFRWMGQRAGVPDLIWQMGVALWWALPALIGVAILLIETFGSSTVGGSQAYNDDLEMR